MRLILITLYSLFLTSSLFAQQEQEIPTVYIDSNGIMRWTDNNKEASFYGVNYTLPFAHAYRAINYTGQDHKKAIDKDVYHFARLGFNAYRIHVWDVEISDKKGNLIKNKHLDLLDYLISKLNERGIRTLITTMTNFGNGYPEQNQDTGGFSYLYDKCKVHSDENAIKAQENYISQFIKHTNPYTGVSYINDPYVIGFEINNEPCHSDSPKQTEEYIDRMLKAMKKTGNKKPVFYNVSHNMSHVQAYFNTEIQGTTYQWYPTGLVSVHTRKGNFLPYVDSYNISFSYVNNFNKKVKAIYEFDPADINYSYMYPAITRTLRSQGFQWITQFSYDPMDIAWANSEYQTHYLNLAYTPSKAISMKIAAEVAYSLPLNKQYPKYPNDTVFETFRISYAQDLSELNSAEKFFYSNNTDASPVNLEKLNSLAGVGNSPLVKYEGTGAYFLDKLEDGLWRLEVMPDAVQIHDPFEKTSLKKEVVTIAWNIWNMEIDLPSLGKGFLVTGINQGNTENSISSGIKFTTRPGVYLLTRKEYSPSGDWDMHTKWKTIRLGEFVAPKERAKTFSVVHQPANIIERGKSLTIKAQIVGPSIPDSVIIYTDKVSFWSESNPYIKMKCTQGYTYEGLILKEEIETHTFKYNIVVCKDNKKYTYPASVESSPLDWDYYQPQYFESNVVNHEDPIELIRITDNSFETYAIPNNSSMSYKLKGDGLTAPQSMEYNLKIKNKGSRFFWRAYIKDKISNRNEALQKVSYLCVSLKRTIGIDRVKIGFITKNGYLYSSILNIDNNKNLFKVSLSEMEQDKIAFLPSPYPTFLERYFSPEVRIPFDIQNIEMIELSTLDILNEDASIEIGNIWLE